MKLIFSGGGTGGHIFPAIAVADEIRKKNKDVNILFVGAKGRIEEKIVPANNYNLETISISGFDKTKLYKNILLPYKIFIALKNCRQILKKFNPDAVIGTGGFASGPMVHSALKLGIKTLIQEGNSYPGKVTRMLADKVDKVVISFEETKRYLKRNDNIIKISYPVRESLKCINRDDANRKFGFDPTNKTLMIFGGSQGASAINNALSGIFERLYQKNINILWQTGTKDFNEIQKRTREFTDKIKVTAFVNEMDIAYSASDLVVCRSGISSVMEIALLSKPAVFIPYPLAADNHQEKNARTIEKGDGCIVILQSEVEAKLYDTITSLINNKDALSALGSNIHKFSDPGSAEKIAQEIFSLTKN